MFASYKTEFTMSVKEVAVEVDSKRIFNSPEILKTTNISDEVMWRWSNICAVKLATVKPTTLN